MEKPVYSWDIQKEQKRIVYSRMRLLNKIACGMDERLMYSELKDLEIDLHFDFSDCYILLTGLRSRVLKQLPEGKYRYYGIAPMLNQRTRGKLQALGFDGDSFYHDMTDDLCFLVTSKEGKGIEEAAGIVQETVEEILKEHVLQGDGRFFAITAKSERISGYSQVETWFERLLYIKGLDFFEMKPGVIDWQWYESRRHEVNRPVIGEKIKRLEKEIVWTGQDAAERAVQDIFGDIRRGMDMGICREVTAQIENMFLQIEDAYRIESKAEYFQDIECLPDINALERQMSERALTLAQEVKMRAGGYHDVTREALQFIHRHYHEGITQKEIAEALGVVPQYLSSRFNEEVGVSVPEYLNRRRIDKAKELLAETDYKMEKIAQMVGLAGASQFYRLFRRFEGCTAGEFRERIRKKREKENGESETRESQSKDGKAKDR